jgi:uncharacterized protein (DUF433 family)
MNAEHLLSRISSDPAICGGRPCIKGPRMRVADIVEALAHGASQQQLLADFDYLTRRGYCGSLALCGARDRASGRAHRVTILPH